MAKVYYSSDSSNDSMKEAASTGNEILGKELDFASMLPMSERGGMAYINARDLHAVLDSGRRFTDWIKDRIIKCDLIRDVDYVISKSDHLDDGTVLDAPGSGKPGNLGVARRVVWLSIPAAKVICIMGRKAIAKQARRYFTRREEELRRKDTLPGTCLEALKALVAAEERRREDALPGAYLDTLKAFVAAEERRLALEAENGAMLSKAQNG